MHCESEKIHLLHSSLRCGTFFRLLLLFLSTIFFRIISESENVFTIIHMGDSKAWRRSTYTDSNKNRGIKWQLKAMEQGRFDYECGYIKLHSYIRNNVFAYVYNAIRWYTIEVFVWKWYNGFSISCNVVLLCVERVKEKESQFFFSTLFSCSCTFLLLWVNGNTRTRIQCHRFAANWSTYFSHTDRERRGDRMSRKLFSLFNFTMNLKIFFSWHVISSLGWKCSTFQ